LTRRVLGAAIEVHTSVGPGLLESVYQEYLAHEFSRRGLAVQRELAVPMTLNGVTIGVAYRADFVVEQKVVVEVKSVDALIPVHEAQLLTYLRLGGFPVGLLINFNVRRLKEGILRRVL
jgi:GxxExxY protein